MARFPKPSGRSGVVSAATFPGRGSISSSMARTAGERLQSAAAVAQAAVCWTAYCCVSRPSAAVAA
jgi:hypothetical protein